MVRRRIYLMRHGAVRYFVPNHEPDDPTTVALTADGVRQSRAAGETLRSVRFDRVITSGLARALDTARQVLEPNEHAATAPPEIEAWSTFEEFRVTELAELQEHEVDHAFSGVFHAARAPREGTFLYGENVGSVLDRVNAALDQLIEDRSWTTALMVLHGGVNRAIISRALTDEPIFLGRLEQTPGCINVLDHGPSWFVRAVNVTPDNLAHEGPRTTSLEEIAADYRAYRGFSTPEIW